MDEKPTHKIPDREPDYKIDGFMAIWVVLDSEGCFDHCVARVKLKDGHEIVYADNTTTASFTRNAQDSITATLLELYADRI